MNMTPDAAPPLATPRHVTPAQTAVLIRHALKEAFGTVSFSVQSRRYAGGGSVTVRWQDGPTARMVGRITDRFTGATFDPVQDLSSPLTHTLAGERVHYHADHVHKERHYSQAFLRRVIDQTFQEFAGTLQDAHLTPADVSLQPDVPSGFRVTCSPAGERLGWGHAHASLAELIRLQARETADGFHDEYSPAAAQSVLERPERDS